MGVGSWRFTAMNGWRGKISIKKLYQGVKGPVWLFSHVPWKQVVQNNLVNLVYLHILVHCSPEVSFKGHDAQNGIHKLIFSVLCVGHEMSHGSSLFQVWNFSAIWKKILHKDCLLLWERGLAGWQYLQKGASDKEVIWFKQALSLATLAANMASKLIGH